MTSIAHCDGPVPFRSVPVGCAVSIPIGSGPKDAGGRAFELASAVFAQELPPRGTNLVDLVNRKGSPPRARDLEGA
jgi:hypothetical protein